PDVSGARSERPPAEVGVLAKRLGERLVEAVQALEQLSLVDDVAGLEPRPARRDRARARERSEAGALPRDRQRRTLHERSGVRRRRVERGREPAWGGLAVVVGERDPPPARGTPAQI